MSLSKEPIAINEQSGGPDPIGWIKRFHRGEQGMIAMQLPVAMLAFLAMMNLVANTGVAVNQKIEVQNTADSVAYSSMLWEARCMNSVTAANHLMGEMMSLVTFHHALGGDTQEDGGTLADYPVRATLAAVTVLAIPASIILFIPDMKALHIANPLTDIKADGMCGYGKLHLKLALQTNYAARDALAVDYLAGVALCATVIGCIIGGPMIDAALSGAKALDIDEKIIEAEWKVLDLLEKFAKNTMSIKKLIRDTLIPGAKGWQHSVVTAAPSTIASVGQMTGYVNNCDSVNQPVFPGQINLFGSSLKLPVVRERYRSSDLKPAEWFIGAVTFEKTWVRTVFPLLVVFTPFPICKITTFAYLLGFERDCCQNPLATSQIMRATWPFVIYDRLPVVVGTVWMVHSDARGLHQSFSAIYCMELIKRFYKNKGNNGQEGVYVMDPGIPGRPQPSKRVLKGSERWANRQGLTTTENMFTLVGYAGRPIPLVMSPTVFTINNGFTHSFAHSEAILYNANQQGQKEQTGQGFSIGSIASFSFLLGGDYGPYQPNIAYDTLNWKSPVDDTPIWEYQRQPYSIAETIAVPIIYLVKGTPKIFLNWQPKLVPISSTRFRDSLINPLRPFGSQITFLRTTGLISDVNTH